ncbi:hypothetical protein A8C56_19925 [Niabella ginsenosidivorans]|uniref:DUF4270 domain-containing protein n=2 Tax=Niabella ginsenosidivorans TaxID=1176587 RepID=A0A1A9I8V4_9BACT|nr:hypothetical protein A8C56_19925 [Niabella ginsenosidivorans]
MVLGMFWACNKADVLFTDSSITEDPNVTYWDNYAVALSTYKLDTFATTGDSLFVLGTHADPLFGKTSGMAFAEINHPSQNPLKDQNVILDSAAVVLVPNGNYYGDTTAPFRLNVYKLTRLIGDDTASSATYYNPATIAYDNSNAIATINTRVAPLRKDSLFLKLADDFAQDLFDQIRNNVNISSNQNSFRTYLKGICIATDSSYNKALFQFRGASGAGLIRIYYTLKGLYNEHKYFDLTYNASKQFNHLSYNYTGTPMASFSPLKSTITESTEMQNTALLSNYLPSYIKITFPDILNVKQTYLYVKVVKAVLEIRVNSTGNAYPYQLPGQLWLYISNLNNQVSAVVTDPLDAQTPQTGNLVVNSLVENGTKYTFDITSYINTLIDEGRFSTKALLLSAVNNNYKSETSRLAVFNKADDPDIRLKLYVLGL